MLNLELETVSTYKLNNIELASNKFAILPVSEKEDCDGEGEGEKERETEHERGKPREREWRMKMENACTCNLTVVKGTPRKECNKTK